MFSQFTSFLGRIRERLDEAGLPYAYLDGKTRDRDQAVQSFRSGAAAVFLISLKAGGFGLNLTEADYCFVLDPWWNPATEAQAVDRTHRIGQTKTVMVYRLVAKDTIEEKVMALKAQKEKLFGAVFSDDALAGGQLTSEEIRAAARCLSPEAMLITLCRSVAATLESTVGKIDYTNGERTVSPRGDDPTRGVGLMANGTPTVRGRARRRRRATR